MLNFEKISKVFFSPHGTTEKIVNEVSKNFPQDCENYDLLSFDSEKNFNNELVIIGVPVFDGRIPKLARQRLSNIKGNNTKAIVVLNYGNIDYGNALLELCELLKENNFNIVGVATCVSQHSQFPKLGENRPDLKDLEKINKFSKDIYDKLENNTENEIFVKGYKPYPNYVKPSFNVNCDDKLCTECMDCVYTCPEEAIIDATPTLTNLDDCSRCSTCINVCSQNARYFSGDEYQKAMENAVMNNFERSEPEFYF